MKTSDKIILLALLVFLNWSYWFFFKKDLRQKPVEYFSPALAKMMKTPSPFLLGRYPQ
jgi:hypothetical protein